MRRAPAATERSIAARRGTVAALAACTLGSLLPGCATTPASPGDVAHVDRLLDLVKQRLAVAPEVARNKWNTRGPIEDLPRERQIIDALARLAPQHGLDVKAVEDFFQAQIDASKLVQFALHAEWAAQRRPPFDRVADLGRDIRPVLDRLTPELLAALARALPVLSRDGGRRLLEARADAVLSGAAGGPDARRAALRPLIALAR